MALRLAIGCSNYLFGEGLKKLLDNERDIDIVGLFHSSQGMMHDLNEILKLQPDVLLADYNPEFSMLLSDARGPLNLDNLKIILIGDRILRHLADKHLKELVLKGVVGILPPSADFDLLKKALRAVTAGELWLDRTILMKILTSMKNQERKMGLAKREKEIVLHICQGYRNKEIAEKLQISEQTVKSHCNRIYKKIGVNDRLQLALYSHKILPESKISDKN
jgi:DNA-binding NarL/FixJ family response regulator